MTATQMVSMIGQSATLAIEQIRVEVMILDVRPQSFGRTDVQVTPVAGSGHQWVSIERVKIGKEGGQ